MRKELLSLINEGTAIANSKKDLDVTLKDMKALYEKFSETYKEQNNINNAVFELMGNAYYLGLATGINSK